MWNFSAIPNVIDEIIPNVNSDAKFPQNWANNTEAIRNQFFETVQEKINRIRTIEIALRRKFWT